MITKDDRCVAVFGVMGGDMQPQGQTQVLLNLIDHKMAVQAAGDAARFHHGGSSEPTGTVMRDGGELHVESDVPPAVVDELRRRGHRIAPAPTSIYGGYQAIWRHDNGERGVVYEGGTERRKDGCAIGY